MSNFDKAVEVLNKHWSVAQESGEADETRCCVRHLEKAGLLAPDLPKPSAEKSIANVAEWFPVPTDPHNPVVWTEPGGTVMVQRLEPGDLTPAEARPLAYALLAAADYAEKEQKP